AQCAVESTVAPPGSAVKISLRIRADFSATAPERSGQVRPAHAAAPSGRAHRAALPGRPAAARERCVQTAAYGLRAPLPYLAEARALYNLLRDGHDRLRYHVSRGHALRHAATGQVELSSYVEAGRWMPARGLGADGTQTDRLLSPHVLARHLAGKYDVAWEAPSWSSLLVFDIDCHVPA